MKLIQLHGDKEAIVDDEDFNFLNQWKWYFYKGYATRCEYLGFANGKQKVKHIPLHRLLMGMPKGIEVDHKNLNRLDNRRENLRFATRGENSRNMPKQKRPTSSKYKGVSKHTETSKWRAYIKTGGEQINLGFFTNEEDAALAYNFAALKLFWEFSRPNLFFP